MNNLVNRVAGLFVFGILFSACSTAAPPNTTYQSLLTTSDLEDVSKEDFLWSGLDEKFQEDHARSNLLASTCFPTAQPPQRPAPEVLGIGSFLIGPIINIVLDQIEANIEA